MLNDFTIIEKNLNSDLNYIDLYSFGDVHIGSAELNLDNLKTKIKQIANNDKAYYVICGDMLDCGIKNSKTNCYFQTLNLQEQKELLYTLFSPIKEKCLAIVPGNHENRVTRDVGSNPLYDVACRLKIEDCYRENVAILKLTLGRNKKGKRVVYSVVIDHGTSINKHRQFTYSFDNVDIFISGHTHTPSYNARCKLRIDLKNNKVSQVNYREIVVNSNLDYGGYGAKGNYLPSAQEMQILRLSGEKKKTMFIATDM